MFYLCFILSIQNVYAYESWKMDQFQYFEKALGNAYKEGITLMTRSGKLRQIPVSSLEYPHKNVMKMLAINKLWILYEECLKYQFMAMGSERFPPLLSVSTYKGGVLNIDCILCVSPVQWPDSVHWYYAKTIKSLPVEIIETENKLIDIDGFLKIYNIQKDDAGIYYCKSGDTKSIAYFVHVFDDDEPLVHIKYGEPKDFRNEIKQGIFVETVWSDWNLCTRCGTVGRRSKFGACVVYVNNTVIDKYSTENKKELIRYFLNGLPCRSPFLPSGIANEKIVKNTPNKIQIGFCKEKCKDRIFEILNEKGEVVDVVNNTAGIYSPLQPAQKLFLQITRKTQYVEIGQKISIPCPGNLNIDTLFDWYMNKSVKILYNRPGVTEVRVGVDPRGRLTFQSFEETDKSLYTCWQRGEISGILRLEPMETYFIQVDHHILLIGLLVILSLFFFLAVKIRFSKDRALAGKYS